MQNESRVRLGAFLAGTAFAAVFAINVRSGHADGPATTFTPGETLSAAKMTNAFGTLEARIADLEKRPGGPASTTIPPGTIVAYGGGVVPEGWVLCDGSTASRTERSALFAAVGTSWGSGDGATTFNLPDLRGMFLRGVDHDAGRDPDRATRGTDKPGGATGDAVGSIQNGGMQSHHHTAQTVGLVVANLAAGAVPAFVVTGTTGVDTSNAGGPETRPRNAYVNYLIKL